MSNTLIDANPTGGAFPQVGDKASGAAFVADTSRGVLAITPDTALAPGRRLAVKCTVAGNVHVTMADGSSETIPVATGLTLLPLAVTKVLSSGTTATATYSNWL